MAISVPESLRLTAPQRQWRAAISVVLPLGMGLAPSFLAMGEVPLCAFKHLTGMPCPLCGGVRVCAALARGDVSSAWLLNPGLLPVLAVAALHGGLVLLEAVLGQRLGFSRALALAWKLAGGYWVLSWMTRLLVPL